MKIYGAITSIMDEVGAIAKEKRNQQQGFMFRGIDDVMNTLHPLMAKHKVFVTPEIQNQTREERMTKSGGTAKCTLLTVKYTFYTDDGSNVSATVIGEAEDSADKSTNKAMSIAFKYACFQVFCIPTEEMQDPDAVTPEPSAPINRADGKDVVKPKYISDKQRQEMVLYCRGKWGDDAVVERFKEYTGYDTTAVVPANEFDSVMQKLADAPPF